MSSQSAGLPPALARHIPKWSVRLASVGIVLDAAESGAEVAGLDLRKAAAAVAAAYEAEGA